MRPASSRSPSRTTAAPRPRRAARRGRGTGSAGCASARPPSAAPSKPARAPAAASSSRRRCRGGDRMIRVLLADDQALVRAGFRMLLEAAGDIEVVAEAANGGTAVALARQHRPDVVLMDLRMPEVDGITAMGLIAADPALGAVRVVVLTTFDDEESVFAALRAGASGFLVKDVEPGDLLRAIRVVARGEALLSPSVTRAVIARFAAGAAAPAGRAPGPARPAPPGLAALTEREREVVTLVAAGLSNEEIAVKLTVSPLTAKTHVSRAMTKLCARDRAQLVVLAYEHGLAARPGG